MDRPRQLMTASSGRASRFAVQAGCPGRPKLLPTRIQVLSASPSGMQASGVTLGRPLRAPAR